MDNSTILIISWFVIGLLSAILFINYSYDFTSFGKKVITIVFGTIFGLFTLMAFVAMTLQENDNAGD